MRAALSLQLYSKDLTPKSTPAHTPQRGPENCALLEAPRQQLVEKIQKCNCFRTPALRGGPLSGPFSCRTGRCVIPEKKILI